MGAPKGGIFLPEEVGELYFPLTVGDELQKGARAG